MCLVISSIAKAAHVGLKEVLSFAFGSRVSLPATLSTWQKAPRKQTGSLQRGERSMCAISGPMRRRTARFQFNPETKSPARCP